PEPPGARIRRLEEVAGFEPATGLVTSGRDRLYEQMLAAGADPRAAANVVMNEFAATGGDPDAADADELTKLLAGPASLPRDTFTKALAARADPGFSAERYLADGAIADASELEPIIDAILAANEPQVAAYRAGKEGLLGFFVGRVMRETQGKADPKVVNDLLRGRLNA